jgi:conjugal transfer pilus assembly protein TraB
MKIFKNIKNLSPTGLKSQQRLYLGVAGIGLFLLILGLVYWNDTPAPVKKVSKPRRISTPLNSIKPEDRWVNRIEKAAESVQSSLKGIETTTRVQEERIKALETILQTLRRGLPLRGQAQSEEHTSHHTNSSPQKGYRPFPQEFGSTLRQKTKSRSSNGKGLEEPQGSLIYHSSLQSIKLAPKAKNIDTYIPSGTHARGILISGLTAYTGVNSVSDPEPLKIRLTDYGVIAKGFKGDIKDAVIIGSCFGEISAERARCRIHTLTLEEENGEIIETSVKGWIMGEDGRSGIRGVVIDRAGEMARAAFGAGLLGGISSFFQKQAQSSIYPVSPFGQTNALKGEELLKSAGTAGVGSALEKLADYAIKRAEKMEPVIVVDAGRQVDVLFKEGFNLSGTQVRQELHRLGSKTRPSAAKTQAQLSGPQTER